MVVKNYYSISDKYSDFFDGLKTTKRIGANQPNPLDENDQTITDINITDINNYKKNKQKKIFTGSDCFEAFWKSYSSSRKGSKETASKAYQKALDRDTAGNILKGAKSYAESAESRGKYGKGCAAWLNDDRWIIDYPREEKPTDKQTPDDIFSTDKTIEEMKKEDDEWSPF